MSFHEGSTKAGLEQKAVHQDGSPVDVYLYSHSPPLPAPRQKRGTKSSPSNKPFSRRLWKHHQLVNRSQAAASCRGLPSSSGPPAAPPKADKPFWLPAGSGHQSLRGTGGASTASPVFPAPLRQAPSSKPSPCDLSPDCPSNLTLWLSFSLN